MKSLFHLMTLCCFMSLTAYNQTPLENFNDEFTNQQTLKNWKLFHEEEGWPNHTLKLDINQSTPNALHLEPQTGFWYGEVHCGPFLYKTIKGNFTVVTRIQVNGKRTEVPEKLFSLAGLMVRSPRPNNFPKTKPKQENWLFMSTGFAKKTKGIPPGPQFETNLTVNSKSNLKIYPAPKGWVDLSISRIGNTFYLMYKESLGSWQCIRTVSNPEMKSELQVGLIAYTDFNNKMKRRYLFGRKKLNTTVYQDGQPDLIAKVDYFRVYRHRQTTPLTNFESLSTSLNLP